MLFDLLLTDPECFFFFLFILVNGLAVLLIRQADNRLQRLHHRIIAHFLRAAYDTAELHAPCRLNDHVVSLSDLQFSRGEEIDLPGSPRT